MLKWFRNKGTEDDPGIPKSFQLISSITMLALVAGGFTYFYWRLATPRMDFYNELWGPAYLLVRGLSPYQTSSLHPVLPAAWLPMAIGFFAPLGWLDEETALQAWFVINVIELCVIIFLALGEGRTFITTTLAAILTFTFPPTLYHLILGQFSLTTALCLLLAGLLVFKEHHWLAAFVLALGLSKPHLAVIAMGGLSLYYFHRGRLKEMLLFWLRVALMVLLLCCPLFLAYPKWVQDALASMEANPSWLHPTLLSLFQRQIGLWGIPIWGLVAVMILVLGYIAWSQFTPITAMYLSLGLAPLVLTYVGSWDFVLLLPILIAAFSQVDWKRKVFLIVSYGLAWYGMLHVQMDLHNEYFLWWVPLWGMLSVALVTPWKNMEETQRMKSISQSPSASKRT